MFTNIRKEIRQILIFGLVLAGLGLVYATSNKALAASNIDAVLTTGGTKYIGHQFSVDVRINTDGNQVDTISMRNLNFDAAKLQYVSTSIQTVFASQTTLINNGGPGIRRLDIGKLPLTANYSNSSHVTFARITFLPINTGSGPTGSTNIGFDFDPTPSTTGSFLSGVKNLNGVTGLTINLAEDNTAPLISNCSPTSGATNVAVTSSVACDFTDGQTGIHLAGTTFNVNGINYTNSGANQFTAGAIANGYRLTVTPASQFSYFTDIPVTATTQDNAYDNGPVLARNSFVLPGYTFRTEDDNDAPEIYSRNPNSGAINIASNANVNFSIRDVANPGGYPGTGIDLATMQVVISAPGWGPVTYTQSGANTFSASAVSAPWNYAISINPATDFPQNTLVNVNVIASDFDNVAPSPNTLNTNYSFTTLDSVAPECVFISPNPGTTNNAVNTSVVVGCSDSGVGVDLDSVIVILNGTAYLVGGPNAFSYSGTPANYTITVDPSADFSVNYAFEVVVLAEDFSSNVMPIVSYGLATGTTATVCTTCAACPVPGGGSTPVNVSNGAQSCQGGNVYVSGSGTLVKEKVVQVPFRTTDEELQNTQLNRINDYDLGVNIEKITIKSDKIFLSGIAQQYANVTLLIESNPLILTTIADAEGKWQIEMENILPAGEHKVFGIARNEKTGEITQKNLFAYLDITPRAAGFTFNALQCVILLIIICASLLAGYLYGKTAFARKYKIKPKISGKVKLQ